MKHFPIFISIVVAALFASCTHNRNIIYLQNLPVQDTSYRVDLSGEYQIRCGDILYVRILSINRDITELYNIGNNTNYTWNSETSLFINGFSVDNEGFVALPTIGKVLVKSLTLDQVHSAIQQKVDESLKDATVIVKLVSYKITLLGEVNRPGVQMVNKNDITIFEALGMAGDVTALGDKENVILMRMNGKELETHYLDLTSCSIITSPYFQLKPNDVIYVKPENARAFQANVPSISIFLSVFANVISVMSLVRLLTL